MATATRPDVVVPTAVLAKYTSEVPNTAIAKACRKVLKYLRQARRCEQVAYRLELINLQPDGPKVKMYVELNLQALRKIHEVAEEREGWEQDVKERLSGEEERRKQAEDVMRLPWIKRIAAKYYEKKQYREEERPGGARESKTETLRHER